MAQFMAKHSSFLGIKGEVGCVLTLNVAPDVVCVCVCVIRRQPSVGHLCIMTLLSL
jgi:hypothetical protein